MCTVSALADPPRPPSLVVGMQGSYSPFSSHGYQWGMHVPSNCDMCKTEEFHHQLFRHHLLQANSYSSSQKHPREEERVHDGHLPSDGSHKDDGAAALRGNLINQKAQEDSPIIVPTQLQLIPSKHTTTQWNYQSRNSLLKDPDEPVPPPPPPTKHSNISSVCNDDSNEYRIPRLPSIKQLQLSDPMMVDSSEHHRSYWEGQYSPHSFQEVAYPPNLYNPNYFSSSSQLLATPTTITPASPRSSHSSHTPYHPLSPCAPLITPQPSPVFSHQSNSEDVLTSVMSHEYGFIETTFSSVPYKKVCMLASLLLSFLLHLIIKLPLAHKRRPTTVDKSSLFCHSCGSKATPEWRRGPKGPATYLTSISRIECIL